MAFFSSSENILLLAFGFGFVIFWHELGHFLAAKWADVKVEQFAVGFGQAMLSWRKGLGFHWGSTQEAFQKRLRSHLESKTSQVVLKEQIDPTEAQLSAAAAELGISETEYRLNWIPLGGYVKMLGQDDLKPGQTVSDPRSYNNKTIGQRMVIVSAGVIMNVILAAIGFIYIFTVGFQVTQPTAGLVIPGSPAQNAYAMVNGKKVITPLRVGDTIISLDGKPQSDFDKIKLNTLLLIAGDTVPIVVHHAGDPDGTVEHLFVTPEKPQGSEFPAIGLGEYASLKAPPADVKDIPDTAQENTEVSLIHKGDVITAVEGKPVGAQDYYVLYDALQKAVGKPVEVTVTGPQGKTTPLQILPHFVPHFDEEPINFAGMQMLARIDVIQANSPLLNKLKPGDVIVNIADPGASGGQTSYPAIDKIIDEFRDAGERGAQLTVTVLRDGKEIAVTAKPTVKLANGKTGFGVQLAVDEADPVVADGLIDGSPASRAKVRAGATITAINGVKVSNWFDVNNIMKDLKPDQPIELATLVEGAKTDYKLNGLTADQLAQIRSNCLESLSAAMLMPDEYPRKAPNLWVAAQWGATETRDAILQVYQTVRSMVKGSISAKEVSGPVGILTAGYMFAERGTTHLVWFLSIISANLAVMNFLPIPIVDGGLFTFLIIEKIKGSPLSQRTQAIAQVVGLALLFSVFAFATYQDVFTRLPMLFR